MKTAKEMFEELGFKIEEIHPYYISYRKYYDDCYWEEIWFARNDKTYYIEDNVGSIMYVDIKTYMAITQQMKELGWIDE